MELAKKGQIIRNCPENIHPHNLLVFFFVSFFVIFNHSYECKYVNNIHM